jgi:histidinol-phosphatase
MATDLGLALALADQADSLTMPSFLRADFAVETKKDQTPVTEVDRAVEAGLRKLLAEQRPLDAVVGEEEGESGSGTRRWVIDPIDGTVNFVRGVPVWATLVALQVGGEVDIGVVSSPVLGRRWWAQRGGGAFVSKAGGPPERLQTSRVRGLAEASISSGSIRDFEPPQAFVEVARRVRRDRGFGDFWQHVLVAEGALDAALEPVCSLWDVAALQVIVEEAGGKFTDFSGQRRLGSGNAISSNGFVHDDLVGLMSGAR